ncbi:MAG: hypothetical protein ACRENF_06245 [Thermodesulfobacteriota bacterium]
MTTENPSTLGQKLAAGLLFLGSAGVIGLGHAKNVIGTRALEEEVLQETARQRGWELTVKPDGKYVLKWYESETQPLPCEMTFEKQSTFVGFDRLVNFYQRDNAGVLEQRGTCLTPGEVRQVAHFGADDHKNYSEDLGHVTDMEILNALARYEKDPASLKIRLEKNLPKTQTSDVDQDALSERREREIRFLQNRLLGNYRAGEAHARGYSQHRVQYRGG